MIKLKNVFIISSFLLTTVNLVFFIYGMDKISHLSELVKKNVMNILNIMLV